MPQYLYDIGYFAGAAVLGGAAGALIGKIVFKQNSVPFIPICGTLAIGLAYLFQHSPGLSDAEVEQILLRSLRHNNEPAYNFFITTKEVAPELYNNIMSDGVQIMRDDLFNHNLNDNANQLRSHYSQYISERIPRLSDQGIYIYTELMIDYFEAMEEMNMERECLDFYFNREIGAFPANDRIWDLETQALRIIATDPLNGSETYGEVRMGRFYQEVGSQFAREIGTDEADRFRSLMEGAFVHSDGVCQMMAVLFSVTVDVSGSGPNGAAYLRTSYLPPQ